MKEEFAKSLDRVLVYEGGKVDDPRDPGGRTNQGVTQRVYTAYRRHKGQPDRDVFRMVNSERDEIYRRQYWDTIRGDELPAGVGFVVFDGAVNSGCSQSVKWLQRALGVTADGHLGLVTLTSLRGMNSHQALIQRITDHRLAFLRQLKTWRTFGKGWSQRVENVRRTGQAWAAASSVVPDPVQSLEEAAKATVQDARKLPTRTPADITTGVGATIAVGTQIVNELKETLAPVENLGYATYILTGVTVAGVVLALAGLVYRRYITVQKRKMSDALGNQAV